MKTRIVYTKFWHDDYILNLNLSEKMLFIYLLTNSSVGLSDIYELSDKIISFETGISNSNLKDIKEKFQKDGKFIFYRGHIKILNCEKYNTFSGEKNEKAKEREISLLNQDILNEIDTLSIPYIYPIHGEETIADSPNNHKSETINKKPEIRNKKYTSQDYFRTLKDNEEELEDLTNNFTCTRLQVLNKAEDFLDYCISNGKRYKNYKSALRNALSKDYGRRVTKDKIPKNTKKYDRAGNVIGGDSK